MILKINFPPPFKNIIYSIIKYYMSKKLCIVCSDELTDTDVFNIHYMCYMRNKTDFNNKKNYKKDIEIVPNDKYCIYCKKKLQRKATKPYHMRCIIEAEKQDNKPCIIKVSHDSEETTIYI